MTVEDIYRPMSIKAISEQAQDFPFNPRLPLKHYLRTARTVRYEADTYLREGNFAQAYRLYLRYTLLVMETIPKYHPEAKTKDGKTALRPFIKELPDVMDNLEKIKPIINKEYQEWLAKAKNRQEQQDSTTTARSTYDQLAARDPSLSAAARLLNAEEHQDLAVDLAQKELSRRAARRRDARRTAGVSAEEEQYRRTAGFWDNWSDELAKKQASDEEIFRQQMESSRRALDGGDDNNIRDFVQKINLAEREREVLASQPVATGTYQYPSISKSEPVNYDMTSARRPSRPHPELLPQPLRPPKTPFEERQVDLAPPRPPAKDSIYTQTQEPSQDRLPELPPKISEAPPSSPAKQRRLTFRPAAYLENGEAIRSVFFPSGMREEFVRLASENTKKGLEMCGVLCGTAVNNALFIRCLVIPEQTCTPDTCETENESALFDYCDREELLQLGWIHTHPTQSCFMSSRDLHTQAGYQIMLPESIAIVCAPRFEPSYGIFRLTNPPGLPHILQCTQTSTFHPHHIDGLYTGAERPGGHVFESDKLDYYVHDLRPGAKNTGY
ncbi:Mov34/MPN/PAD-1 family protein [Xylariales sp. PMI_506]|nr:Mov34/MPN/PAD-1 family protein [Xylariales sp. PMI_506]